MIKKKVRYYSDYICYLQLVKMYVFFMNVIVGMVYKQVKKKLNQGILNVYG